MAQPADLPLSLLLRGHRDWDDLGAANREQQVVRDWLESITATDIEDAIAAFEYTDDPQARWVAARALIAFFRWCWRMDKSSVGNRPVDDFILRFARASFLRIAGDGSTYGDEGNFLPTWSRPDIAFGREKPNHRPEENNDIRDIAIAMWVEFLRRTGMGVSDAKSRAATRFGVSVDVVAKAMSFGNKLEFGKRFASVADAKLQSEVDDYFAAKLEKSTL